MAIDTTSPVSQYSIDDLLGQILLDADEFCSSDEFEFIEAILLKTQHRQLLIEVEADIEKLNYKVFDTAREPLVRQGKRRRTLKTYVGCPISLIWKLEDAWGRLDALQFMFSPKSGSDMFIVQFMALDSQVVTFRLIQDAQNSEKALVVPKLGV